MVHLNNRDRKLVEQLKEEIEILDDQQRSRICDMLEPDPTRELIRQTCETFTNLLLSLTPFKAKEFVERNCAKVTRRIMRYMDEKTLERHNIKKGGLHYDD
jgi:hypothetical protein